MLTSVVKDICISKKTTTDFDLIHSFINDLFNTCYILGTIDGGYFGW